MDYNLFLQLFCVLFSLLHNFVQPKLVILFSRLNSFFLFSIESIKNYKKLPTDPTPTPPTITSTTVRCPLTRERRGSEVGTS